MKTALVIFAREPIDGKVKTRLCQELPTTKVTLLYKTFVRDVLNLARKISCDRRFIFYAGSNHPLKFLKQFKNDFILKRQQGENLGERMHQAFLSCYKKKISKTIIIGTDCLTMTQENINKAFGKLSRFDCVLGPSLDGGYYLIGLREPDERIFQDISWSTAHVLPKTLRILQKLRKKVFLLPMKDDIDTVDSLKNLWADLQKIKNRNTYSVLKKILETN